jgi:hypothetical protein
MQIKTTMKYYYIPTRKMTTPNVVRCGTTGALTHYWWKCKMV